MSKSLAYQKFVYIIARPARRYVPRVSRTVEVTTTPLPRNTNYAEAKGYHPISLLHFMQKAMQKLVARNIRGKSLCYVPHPYTNLPINHGSQQTPQCTM
jgi:hypothetical protein